MRSKNRLIFAVLIGASPINAIASEIGDTEDSAALRNQYIQAVESNNPDAVGGLVTDDFVMLQPNKKGPDTYIGVNLITGEREVQSSDFWYMFSKQNGEWKLGPMAISWEEM